MKPFGCGQCRPGQTREDIFSLISLMDLFRARAKGSVAPEAPSRIRSGGWIDGEEKGCLPVRDWERAFSFEEVQ